jgi:tetratricopeptide (TPR) repeat protein
VTRYFRTSAFIALLLAVAETHVITAKQSPTTRKPPTTTPPEEAGPPEEDESLIPEKVALNPMEAERSIKVGVFYMHKGKFRAAVQRFTLATRYNPSSPDAFFKLGEAEERLKDNDAAKTAFEKVMRLAPNTKLAQEAQKKLDKKS